jgi:Co/Zn/Cd efflux system component
VLELGRRASRRAARLVRLAPAERQVGPPPGAALGQDVYCQVSGVVKAACAISRRTARRSWRCVAWSLVAESGGWRNGIASARTATSGVATAKTDMEGSCDARPEGAPDGLLDCGAMSAAVERKTLVILLSINAAMFVVELGAGWIADSMGLVADSLDMLADACVYGAALLASGSTNKRKTRTAFVSGIMQLTLAAGVGFEVARRAVEGSEPLSGLMIAVSFLALCANAVCLALLHKHRDGEIHMRASWIFSTTDVQANLGVIIAGLLVMLTASAWPDLVIGLGVCGLVVRGGVRILRQARASYKGTDAAVA